MTTKQLHDFCEAHEDDFLKFEEIPVERRMSNRPDLHAFLLLDKLVPDDDDIVGSAEHDEIWLDVDLKKFRAAVTKEQLLDLYRCGVRYDENYDTLSMFV